MIVAIVTLKILHLIISIFAFATTLSVSTSSQFVINCNGSRPVQQEIKFGYPFKLTSHSFEVPLCANEAGEKTTVRPYGDFSAPSQFYVLVGVMAFVYSLATVVLYIYFDDQYRKYGQIPIADFVITVIFALLWLISSATWADKLTQVKRYTDPKELWIVDYVHECHNPDPRNKCSVLKQGNFSSLNVSIFFGFLNTCAWGSNLWFLYRETKWFKVQPDASEQNTDPIVSPDLELDEHTSQISDSSASNILCE